MKTITFIPTDRRIKNAIISKICKENDIDIDMIYCNAYYNYMEYRVDIRFLSTIYKGIEYNFEYFSGCFNAYMVANVLDFKYSINEYNHYLLYNNEGVKVHVEAGWEIDNDVQRLYNNYLKNK